MLDSHYEAMVRAYIECAIWADLRDDEGNAGALDGYEPDDLAYEAMEQARADVRQFLDENADDLADMDPEQAGHDFWLTRNRHGAGFWDRGLGAKGQRLTEAAHPYGESWLYVGDDDRLYFN